MAGEPVGSPGTIRSASFVFCPEVVPVLKALLDGKLAIGNTAGPDVVHDVRLVEQHALALGLFRRLFGEQLPALLARDKARIGRHVGRLHLRSEEHTSELQSLMRISYAVFCLKTKTN